MDNPNTFNNLGIAPKLLEILASQNFVHPTPIQQQTIPVAIEGKDLMGIAQTGTGKTLAFGIPMIQRLAQSEGKSRGLVILPTRELAMQVEEALKKIGHGLGLRTALLIGGESMRKQINALRQIPHIIIATPGRLNDHLESTRLDLSKTTIVVLDEADRMLDMGFAPQIKRVLQRVPIQRQTMLFSATMPPEIVKIAHSYMSFPLRVEVAPAGTTVASVTQEVFFCEKSEKFLLLNSVLSDYSGSILVFSRTKHGARKITKAIRDMGHTAAEIHSNRSLGQRKDALEGFKIGRYRILVATDIASRGIDVNGIELVLNYDLPETAEDYVHRIGRTGRAGMTGHAISFATPEQQGDIRRIERLIKKPLPISKSSLTGKYMGMQPQSSRPSFSSDSSNNDRPQGHRKFAGRSWTKHRRRGAPQRPGHGGQGGRGGYFMKNRHGGFSR